MTDQVREELARRLTIWAELNARRGPDGVRPEVVKELRIHLGQQGIFRDLELTRIVSGAAAGEASPAPGGEGALRGGGTMARFYGHFAAAYGTFWLCLFVAAVVSQSHVNAGTFGMCGFPVLALVYAVARSSVGGGEAAELGALRERVRLLEARLSDRAGE